MIPKHEIKPAVCPKCGASEYINSDGYRNSRKRWRCNERLGGCGRSFYALEAPREMRDDSPRERTKLTDNGNYATAELWTLKNVTTLEELLEFCEVDLGIWEVDKWVANKWPMTMKFGEKGKEKPVQVQQYQIKAWLIRKVPIKHAWPIIQPVKMYRPAKPNIIKDGTDKVSFMFITDSQNGFRRDMRTGHLEPMHDRNAWDLVIQAAHTLKPDRIVLGGDMLDLSEWSDKFIKHSDFYFCTQAALEETYWWLSRLVDAGAQIDYLPGNHEERFPKAITTNMVAAYDLHPANEPDSPEMSSLQYWMNLNDLGIKYHKGYPEACLWLNQNIRASHGEIALQESGATVGKALNKANCSEIVGHSHRLEMASKTTHQWKGARTYMVYSAGTLARIDADGPPSKGSRQNWQHGFARGWYQVKGKQLYEVNLQAIYGGKTMLDGNLYEAQRGIDKIVAAATGVENLI